MTPIEWARKIFEYRHEDLLIYEAERVIKAAIEEDRKSRECCKQEREACAMIIEEEYRQSLLRNDPNPGIDPMMTATKIRARSEKGE